MKENMMTKKCIINALIEKELSTLDDICDVLEKLDVVKKPDLSIKVNLIFMFTI